MSVILEVEHTTVYRYARPVAFGEHRVMFRPRSGYDVQVLDLSLEVSPEADIRSASSTSAGAGSIRRSHRMRGSIRSRTAARNASTSAPSWSRSTATRTGA